MLPPSSRASTGEVADLLGAQIAYAEHGDKLLDASDENGAQGVAEFYDKQHAAAAKKEEKKN